MGNVSEEYKKIIRNITLDNIREREVLIKNIFHLIEIRAYASHVLLLPESNKQGLPDQIEYCNQQLRQLLNL